MTIKTFSLKNLKILRPKLQKSNELDLKSFVNIRIAIIRKKQ
jgi:hypothetical protein